MSPCSLPDSWAPWLVEWLGNSGLLHFLSGPRASWGHFSSWLCKSRWYLKRISFTHCNTQGICYFWADVLQTFKITSEIKTLTNACCTMLHPCKAPPVVPRSAPKPQGPAGDPWVETIVELDHFHKFYRGEKHTTWMFGTTSKIKVSWEFLRVLPPKCHLPPPSWNRAVY